MSARPRPQMPPPQASPRTARRCRVRRAIAWTRRRIALRQHRIALRRARNEMRALPDRMLKDMGISRSEIDEAVADGRRQRPNGWL